MKLLFVHDGPVLVDANSRIYPQTPPTDVLHRYLALAKQNEDMCFCTNMSRTRNR